MRKLIGWVSLALFFAALKLPYPIHAASPTYKVAFIVEVQTVDMNAHVATLVDLPAIGALAGRVLSPDGSRIAYVASDKRGITVRDFTGAQHFLPGSFLLIRGPDPLRFSPDSKFLAATSDYMRPAT